MRCPICNDEMSFDMHNRDDGLSIYSGECDECCLYEFSYLIKDNIIRHAREKIGDTPFFNRQASYRFIFAIRMSIDVARSLLEHYGDLREIYE